MGHEGLELIVRPQHIPATRKLYFALIPLFSLE